MDGYDVLDTEHNCRCCRCEHLIPRIYTNIRIINDSGYNIRLTIESHVIECTTNYTINIDDVME